MADHLKKWWMVHSVWILGLVVALWGPFSQYVANNPKFALFVALGAVVIAKISPSPIASSSNTTNPAVSQKGLPTGQAGFAKLATMRLTAVVCVILFTVALAGCNAYQTAQRAQSVVAAVIAVAQADLPSLQATGVFSASEGQAVTNYLTLATNLNGQYATCLTNANNTVLPNNKKSKFLACLTTFAAGLSNPQELAQLRVLSPKAQQQVQLWVTAASVGISSVIAALGGQAAPAPQVAEKLPDAREMNALAKRVGLENIHFYDRASLAGY